MSFDLDATVLKATIGAFGEKAQGQALPVYTPAGGAPFDLDGVFDQAYREIDQLTGLPVSAARPVFGVRISQFPTGIIPAQGDAVTIRAVAYVVREARPDGHGHALLLLNKV